MNVDPEGHFALSTFLVCLGIGALVGFGGTVAVDYADDGMLFNGSVSLGGYIANTLVVAALFASILGAWFAGSTSISFSLPSIGSMLTSSGAPVAAAATTVEGAAATTRAIVAVGILVLAKMPRQGGEPNSTVVHGGSTGVYDANGNLISRRDTTGKPHFIKELGKSFLPHTHVYEWDLIENVWRIVKSMVLPY